LAMKGSRAKKAAEAAAAGGGEAPAGGLTPVAPQEPRSGPPRPGPIACPVGFVQIQEETFRSLCQQIRTNQLLGAAAADALEEAAGLRATTSPQGSKAKDLRSDVAQSRAEAPKPKKKVGGFADEVDEIPDLPDEVVEAAEVDEPPPEKEADELPELNLSPKQNNLRTNLEMWVMDDIPVLFGVDDSEDLEEDLQEDGQADMITRLIAESRPEAQQTLLDAWLKSLPDAKADEKAEFASKCLGDVAKIQELGPKKGGKKKKPKA